jgi:uncharacterized protein (TIGR02145 family)
MDNEKGKSLITTGSSNLAKTEKLLSITQKILSEIKPQYESVRISNQEWMTINLDVDRFRNGDLIPHVESDEEWEKVGKNGQPAWCYYDNDTENGKKYGKLYNWYAVNDPRGLAPEGWHVPSDEEWTDLVEYLGGYGIAGHKMKSVEGWEDWEDEDGELQNGNGNNSSGFNGLPGGYRINEGSFFTIRFYAFFWSATEYDYFNAWNRSLYNYNGNVYRYYYHLSNKSVGASVRCLRDDYLPI